MINPNIKVTCKYLALLSLVLGLWSCEDEITVPSEFEGPSLVVDAWLTNQNIPQTIVISQTVDYFDGGQPAFIDNASVQVCKTSTEECFDFIYTEDGKYVWIPEPGQTFGAVEDEFSLVIQLDGQTYGSTEIINRTAEIDSIGVDFEEESIAFEEGLYAQLYARDLPGRGDTYWIRAYKNDTLLNRPFEILPVYDATFDAGADIDGQYFINRLRLGINALDEDGGFIPYQIGDKVRGEVHSINNAAFSFLSIAAEQITNEGIFAVPVANAPGNIINQSTGESLLGIFNIAEVSSMEITVEQ